MEDPPSVRQLPYPPGRVSGGWLSPSLPTTTATEEPPVDPLEHCELNPEPGFAGEIYACSGEFSTRMVFDYYGDADIPLDAFLPCADESKISPKPAGYVYTCFLQRADLDFGPESTQGDAQDVEACCLSGSPEEAVDPFCRIAAAEDLCVAASNRLNGLRHEKVFLAPALDEISGQLENLNLFLAASQTQTSCSKTFAKGLVDAGDFPMNEDSVRWDVESPLALDPEHGWPWFRDIRLTVAAFELEGMSETGATCTDAGLGSLQGGGLKVGRVVVSDSESERMARIDRLRPRRSGHPCALDAWRLSAPPLVFRRMRLGTAGIDAPVDRGGDWLRRISARAVLGRGVPGLRQDSRRRGVPRILGGPGSVCARTERVGRRRDRLADLIHADP